MKKIQFSWWFKDAVDGICRGKDVLEVEDDFNKVCDEGQIENLMSEAMQGSTYSSKNQELEKKLPNFSRNKHSPEPQNWGILKIILLKEA